MTAVWTDVTQAFPNHPTVLSGDELKYWNVLSTGLLPHVCGWWTTSPKWEYLISISRANCMSADSCFVSVGSGFTQREDLARLQRTARCEEDDFHRVSLQQSAKAVWCAALRPRLWPHEQVGFLKLVLFHTTLHYIPFTVGLLQYFQFYFNNPVVNCCEIKPEQNLSWNVIFRLKIGLQMVKTIKLVSQISTHALY